MAEFNCASCGFTKDVPDKLAGRKAKCPKCGETGLVAPLDTEKESPKQIAHFFCGSCGHERDVPGKLAGRKAKCPKCGATVAIAPLAAPPSVPKAAETPPPAPAPVPPEPDDGLDEDIVVVMKGASPEERDGSHEDGDIDLGDIADKGAELSKERTDFDDSEDFDEDEEKDLVIPSHVEQVQETGEKRPFSLFAGNPAKNLFAGLVSGCMAGLFALAFSYFIFSGGALAQFFPHALGVTLATAAVVGMVTALGSWVPFSIAGPESTVSVVLFLLVSSIAAQMSGAPPLAVYVTCLTAFSLTAVAAGLGLCITGRLKAGAWVRFIPYQVVGGIMAGIGFFVLKGVWESGPGMPACAGALYDAAAGMNLETALGILDSDQCRDVLPGLVFGLVLMLFHSRARNTLIILLLSLLAVGATHGYLYWQHIPLEQAAADGLLFSPYPTADFVKLYDPELLQLIDRQVIRDHAGYMAAMVGLIIATFMYKITKLEISTGRDVNLDHEIKVLGLGNILSGLAMGMPGNLSMGRSNGNRYLGAGGPLAGMVAAGLCLAAVFQYGPGLGYIPVFIPQGMLYLYGLSILGRWLVKAKREFTHARDYVLLFSVFLLTVILGFLPGLAIGTALALMLMISQYGKVRVVKHMLSGASYRSNVDRAPDQLQVLKSKGGQVYALKLQGFIFLGTINRLISIIMNRIDDPDQPPLRFILLDFTYVSGLDSTVTMSFTRLKQLAKKHEMTLIFSSLSFDLERQLEEGGFAVSEPDNSSLSFVDLDHAMEWCENRILDEAGALSTRRMSLPELLESVFPLPEYLPQLMEYLEEEKFNKDEYIFKQGDPSDAMYFLRSGMITIELEIDGYKKLRLKKLGPGTVFGEMGIYTYDPRSASALASEDSVLYRLSTSRLKKMQETDPKLVSAVHHFVVNLLAGRVADTNEKVRDLLR